MILQSEPNPSQLATALVELVRIIKTLHILNYCDYATYRRDIQRILNRGESRNGLARDGGLGQFLQRYQAGQENQLGAPAPSSTSSRSGKPSTLRYPT